MKDWCRRLTGAMVVAGITVSGAAAQDVVDMSLESILNMKVSVASKKAEAINEAPGIVSVITADEIRRMGAESLTDIIQTIPGVTTSEGYFGYTDVSVRGILENNYNSRTLFMINGAPVSNANVSSYILESTIPIDAIERIEIIRGPGSVLYGNGAFAGVINLITKKGVNVSELRFKGGSNNTGEQAFDFGRGGEKGSALVSYIGHRSDGFKAQATDEIGMTNQLGADPGQDNGYQKNYNAFFGNVEYRGFGLDMMYSNQLYSKYGVVPIHRTTGQNDCNGGGATLRYNQDIGKASLHAQARYYRVTYESPVFLFPPYDIYLPIAKRYDVKNSGDSLGADLDGTVPLASNLSLLAGVSYEELKADPSEWTDSETGQVSTMFSVYMRSYETHNTSAYSQIEYLPFAPLKLVGGLRYNNNKEYGSTTVPRLSAVYRMTDKLSLKALYGSAFRNPSFLEKYVNTQNLLYGDPNLKPEKISTAELGLDWTLRNSLVRVTGFHTTTDDMIRPDRLYMPGETPEVTRYENRGTVTSPINTSPTSPTYGYANGDGQDISGGELEVRSELLARTLSGFANFSYKEGREKATNDDIQYLDKYVANAGLTYLRGRLTGNVYAHYVAAREGTISVNTTSPNFAPGQKITVPAQTVVNLKASYAVTPQLELSLIVINLFEETVVYPENSRRYIDVVPGDSGRNVYGEVTCRF